MGFERIIVATDGSDTAQRAVAKAARIAAKTQGRVILVAAAGGSLDAAAAKAATEAAAARLTAEGIDAEAVVRDGSPADVVLAVAGENAASLIVAGNVGMGRSRRLGFGPIPERIAREAPCDVLVVFTKEQLTNEPTTAERIYDRIVVGTDGSSTASEASRKAFHLGMIFGIGVTLVYAGEDALVGEIVLEQTAKTKPRALGVERVVVAGGAAEEICRIAAEAGNGLAVVGNRGMTGARRVVLGSVPSEVAHRATTDVMIAKTADRTIDDLAPGTGAVVTAEGRKLAVYKAEDGSLVALHPRCHHMGCTVDWNASEQTWDCPCHGSRYAKDGALLCGPSEKPLDPADL